MRDLTSKIARAGPGQKQEPRTPSESPTCVAGTQAAAFARRLGRNLTGGRGKTQSRHSYGMLAA